MTIKELIEKLSMYSPEDKVMIEVDKTFNAVDIEVYDEKTDESIPVAYFDLVRNNLSDDLYA